MTIQHNPTHPGAFIKRVYLAPFGIASKELARELQVSTGLISCLINEKADISPAMALKLSKVLGRSPESWLLMQNNYDLWQADKRLICKTMKPWFLLSVHFRSNLDDTLIYGFGIAYGPHTYDGCSSVITPLI